MNAWRGAIAHRDPDVVTKLDATFREQPDRYASALVDSARSDGDERVRAFSTRVLGKLGRAELAAVFSGLLADGSPYVRLNAAWALGELSAAGKAPPATRATIASPEAAPQGQPRRGRAFGRARRTRAAEVMQDATVSAQGDRGRAHEMMLSIGGLVGHVELVGAPAVFIEQVRARYGAFEMPAAPSVVRDFSLRLDLMSAKFRQAASQFWETHPLVVSVDGDDLSIDRWDLSVRMTPAPTARRKKTGYVGQGHCEMNPFSLDCVLRVIWSTLLPRLGGFLIHGCALRHAEVGFVFPGQSGAGKTTLARKAPDPDDVLIRRAVGGASDRGRLARLRNPILGGLRPGRHLHARLSPAHPGLSDAGARTTGSR